MPTEKLSTDGATNYVWEDIWKDDQYSSALERSSRAARREAVIRRILGPQERLGDVVEFGCGDGSLSKLLIEDPKWGVRSYIGVDRSKTAICRAKSALPHPNIDRKFIQADIFSSGIPPKSADCVIACGLLEHIQDIEHALQLLHQVCRNSGKLILTTSNALSLMYIDRRWREFMGCWPYGFQINYTPNQWSTLLGNKFYVHALTIEHGDWDLPFSAAIDRSLSIFNKNIGRYIVSVATPRK